jgi:hypothetical protein
MVRRDLVLGEDRHLVIFKAIRVHVELARERLEPVEVDHLVDPRRMVAQTQAFLGEVRRAPGGEHEGHPVGEQATRRIPARDETRPRLQSTAVGVREGARLVEDLEVDREQIVDRVEDPHLPGVLQRLAR